MARLSLLNGELQHRIKNILTVVQSIVSQSAASAGSSAELKLKVEARLGAMGRALDLLADQDEPVVLSNLVKRILEPFAAEHDFSLSGPDLRIPAKASLPIALLMLELATNAVKYGALSVLDGSVSVTWELAGKRVLIRWAEAGGPVVRPPARRGFGTRLVQAAVPDGKVQLEHHPTGVACLVEVELAEAGAQKAAGY